MASQLQKNRILRYPAQKSSSSLAVRNGKMVLRASLAQDLFVRRLALVDDNTEQLIDAPATVYRLIDLFGDSVQFDGTPDKHEIMMWKTAENFVEADKYWPKLYDFKKVHLSNR